MALLWKLNGDGSPMALGELPLVERTAAFAPPPTILPTSDILFEAWALTTIRDKLPGRPTVADYLHGINEWEPPQTKVAWREEVEEITGEVATVYKPKDLLELYPLKPHELLAEPTYRAFKHFEAIAKRQPDLPAWLVDDDDVVTVLKLEDLADEDKKYRLANRTGTQSLPSE